MRISLKRSYRRTMCERAFVSCSVQAVRDLTRYPRVARGHVQNGVVVLDGGVRLPEGQEVTVLAHATP